MKKTSNLNLQIQWVENTKITKLDLNIKSEHIPVGNSFQHFLTNETEWTIIILCKQPLRNRRIFIFEIRFPSIERLLQQSGRGILEKLYR